MTLDTSKHPIVDEINRLLTVYEKAKEYISNVTTQVEDQIVLWQNYLQDMNNQSSNTTTSSPYDYLVTKVQRMNELALDGVQGLCRAEILMEQIHRIAPNSGFLERQKTYPNNLPKHNNMETKSFVPVNPHKSLSNLDSRSITSPLHQPTVNMRVFNELSRDTTNYQSAFGARAPLTDISTTNTGSLSSNRIAINYLPRPLIRPKNKVKLQRIPPGTKWKRAKIDVVDSLSGFYVYSVDEDVYREFLNMQNKLNDYYHELEKSNQMKQIDDVSIGDFGVAKFCEDNVWYRARSIMRQGIDQIKIVFIDYGNIETIPVREFFPIEKQFTTLPAQAIGCSLSEAFSHPAGKMDPLWSDEVIETFRQIVANKILKVSFVNQEQGVEQWPLHFVQIELDTGLVNNHPDLKPYIDPRPNKYIVDKMADTFSQNEYILFNVPFDDDNL